MGLKNKGVSKSSKSVSVSTEDLSAKDIADIKDKIFKSSKNFNLINKLLVKLEKVEAGNVTYYRLLIFKIYEIFEYFISKKLIKVFKGMDKNDEMINKWINSKYVKFQSELERVWNLQEVSDEINTLKLDILDIWFKLLKCESKYLKSSDEYFPNKTYSKIVKMLISHDVYKTNEDGTINDFLLLEFKDEYFSKYWDLKFYFFQDFELFDDIDNDLVINKLITLIKDEDLYDVKNVDEITEMNLFIKTAPKNTLYSVNSFKNNFEKTWIHLLNLKIQKDSTYINLLNILHKRILPFMADPKKLFDFLISTYSYGIKSKDVLLSILSLNGLWLLMKDYNLEYPNFYSNLYKLLIPDLLKIKEKSRFFRLLDLFLSSSHLSSAIIASFIKRLSRLSLNAPISSVILMIPFIYNLIKKYNHSTCILLLHSTTTEEQDKNYVDSFEEFEEDPALTNAIESSIWELESMNNHYHPNVSSLIKIFKQKFNKFSYNIEDFLDWNYEKLILQENGKKFKGELTFEFEKFDNHFDYLPEYDF